MIEEYQKKLESKNNAYNQQFGKILTSKSYQTMLENKPLI